MGHFRTRKRERFDHGRNFPGHFIQHANHRIFRNAKRGSGVLGHPTPRLLSPPPPPPHSPAVGRGRPRAAKRRCGWRAASVHGSGCAGWELSARGPGVAGTAQSAETYTDGGDPTAAPLRSPTPAQYPPVSRPAQPCEHPSLRWLPRPGRPHARGALCPGRRCCSWPRCCRSSTQPGLQVRAARGGLPGSPCLLTCSLSTFMHHPPRLSLRGPPPRFVLAACRVTNLGVLIARG